MVQTAQTSAEEAKTSRADSADGANNLSAKKQEPSDGNGLFRRLTNPRFSLSSVFEHYPILRFAGYVFSGSYSSISRFIDLNFEKMSGYQGEERQRILDAKKNGEDFKPSKRANMFTNRLEFMVFIGWTMWSFFKDRKKYKYDVGSSVAAELGVDPDNVGMKEMYKSKNPLIQTMVDRFTLQNATRLGSDIMFLMSVQWGIVGKAVSYTLERSGFIDRTAFDILKEMMTEVQYDKFEYDPKSRVVKALVNSVQRSRRDHKNEPHSDRDIQALMPVFEKMSELIVKVRSDDHDKPFGLNEVTYLLGEITNNPDPFMAYKRFQLVRDKGLREMAWDKSGKQVEQELYTWSGDKRYLEAKQRREQQVSDELPGAVKEILEDGKRTKWRDVAKREEEYQDFMNNLIEEGQRKRWEDAVKSEEAAPILAK